QADHWGPPLRPAVNDSGGIVGYITPGVLVSLGSIQSRWSIRGSVQIPVFADVIGSQKYGPAFQAGLFKAF
ncbi:MAG TPA: hypothetical protein VMV18_10385, partial [bacterium]|nr:hypothetical protein [bacterium]